VMPAVAAQRPTESLFFAVYPDHAAATRIARLAARLREEHGLTGRPFAVERFHATLHHLGSHAGVPALLFSAASEAAATIAMPPFEVVFDRVESFPRRARLPFVLCGGDGVAGLAGLQRALGAALKGAGLAPLVKPDYTPHLTLLYDDRRIPVRAVEPIAWTVHELVLVRSLLGRGQHVPIARWPLHKK
jgi:2'-5' RNA ligase